MPLYRVTFYLHERPPQEAVVETEDRAHRLLDASLAPGQVALPMVARDPAMRAFVEAVLLWPPPPGPPDKPSLTRLGALQATLSWGQVEVEAQEHLAAIRLNPSLGPGLSYLRGKPVKGPALVYEAPTKGAAAWLELFTLAEHGLRVKACLKCNAFFVPWPPNVLHCPTCRQGHTRQALYRGRKQEDEGWRRKRREYQREYMRKRRAKTKG